MRESLINRTCRSGERLERIVEIVKSASARGGPKPVDRSTASYHAGAQTPSLARRPAGQRSMLGVNATLKAAHRAAQAPPRDF